MASDTFLTLMLLFGLPSAVIYALLRLSEPAGWQIRLDEANDSPADPHSSHGAAGDRSLREDSGANAAQLGAISAGLALRAATADSPGRSGAAWPAPRCTDPDINPATGLPMLGLYDTGGNLYGFATRRLDESASLAAPYPGGRRPGSDASSHGHGDDAYSGGGSLGDDWNSSGSLGDHLGSTGGSLDDHWGSSSGFDDDLASSSSFDDHLTGSGFDHDWSSSSSFDDHWNSASSSGHDWSSTGSSFDHGWASDSSTGSSSLGSDWGLGIGDRW